MKKSFARNIQSTNQSINPFVHPRKNMNEKHHVISLFFVLIHKKMTMKQMKRNKKSFKNNNGEHTHTKKHIITKQTKHPRLCNILNNHFIE